VIRRLLLGYVGIVLVLAGALAIPFGLVFAQRQREQFAVALERDAVVLATFYEDALQHLGIVESGPAEVYAARTGARVVIVDRTGTSLVDTGGEVPRSFVNRPEIVTALAGDRFSGTRYSKTLDADLFIVAVPVASGTEVFGAVRLTMLNGEIEARVRRMWLSLGLVVLVAVGATALVAFVVARSITRPVEELRQAATKIAEGDLAARAAVADAPPELLQLAVTFDRMAARLEALVESQRAFVADASHQLRTPLTALRLRLENLRARAPAPEADDIDEIVFETERLSRLVDQLLELSRAGEAPVVPVEVVEVVDQRVRLWSGMAGERDVTLETVSDGACRAGVIHGGLEQILDNLLDNAIRYTPAGGTVQVTVTNGPDGGCVVEVADSGPGVDDDELARLFDRFWRGDTEEPGTGLGLAIVAHLVRRSGGTVLAGRSGLGGLSVRVALGEAPSE